MKIRNGFVSNSSSSSFYIASKEPLTEEALIKALGIVPSSPVERFMQPFVDYMLGGEELTKESLFKNYCCKDECEFLEEVGDDDRRLQLLNDGWKITEIYGTNEGDGGAEAFFYNCDLEVDSPTIKMWGDMET